MKATALTLVFVASVAPFALAGEVAPGASLAEVRATLGIPRGELQLKGRQVLYYERGSVELQDGQVTAVALRSVEEHAARTAREVQLRAERESVRSRLAAAGMTLRDAKLADPAFKEAPLAYQVSFWESFAQSYPEVSCREPLTIARLRLQAQWEEQQRRDEESDRLMAMAARLAAAERESTFYPIRFYPSYRGRHHYYREASLGPITYNFHSTSLAPYSTPAGNPAGSLRGSLFEVTSPVTPSTVTGWWDAPHCDNGHGRGAERGRGHSRNRM